MPKATILFLFAGISEIGGCYLIWQYVKGGKPVYFGILGAVLLIVYGVFAAYQPTNFARTFAIYGGVFIILSMLFAMILDGFKPNNLDITGLLLILVGIIFIYFSQKF